MPTKANPADALQSALDSALDAIAEHFMLPIMGKGELPPVEISDMVRDFELKVGGLYRREHDALVDKIGPASRRLRGKPGGGKKVAAKTAPKTAAEIRAALER